MAMTEDLGWTSIRWVYVSKQGYGVWSRIFGCEYAGVLMMQSMLANENLLVCLRKGLKRIQHL